VQVPVHARRNARLRPPRLDRGRAAAPRAFTSACRVGVIAISATGRGAVPGLPQTAS
jgi:hypothetical protein